MSDSINPYVGPRAFLETERLFGRDEEICDLQDLLMAERIVLLYSPSGAGKTSLVLAGVAPRLREEGFDVFAGIRVNLAVPVDIELPPNFNRYAYSVLDSLERTRTHDLIPRTALASMSLCEYFGKRFPRPEKAEQKKLTVFHFDQFEEVVAVDPTDEETKRAFFRDLGLVLRDGRFWALFAMREEALAAVDAYAPFLPTRLQARLRLDFLSPGAAEEAIRQPAALHGVTFSAAPDLVCDLSLMRVQRPDGSMLTVPGPWIEPVQLQVACRSLWTKPRAKADEISESDRMGVVDVDSALGEYYDECLAKIAAASKTKDRDIRDWIGTQLITARGVRTQVLQDVEKSMGLDNAVLELLRADHLIRAEERRGQIWYELAHDRLVEPIRTSNMRFAKNRLNPFQTRAREWNAAGRKAQLLLRDAELVAAERWRAENNDELTEFERSFLAESVGAVSEFEQLVYEWELADRNPALLARGKLLQSLLSAERKRPLTTTATSFLNLSQEITRLERSARVRSRVSQVLAAVVILGVMFGGAALKSALDRKTAQSRLLKGTSDDLQRVQASLGASILAQTYAVDPTDTIGHRISQVVDAQKQITAIAKKAEAPPATRIKYWRKQRDSARFAEALDDLGFEVEVPAAKTTNPTNCMWYGPHVPENDVRLVAYAAIRAGIELQGIQPARNPEGTENLIEIGHRPTIADEPPFSVEQVAKSSLADLRRSYAKATGKALGVVKDFDPERGAGTIVSENGEGIFLRTLGDSGTRFNPGDRVRYYGYSGTRRKYALNPSIATGPDEPEVPPQIPVAQ